MDTECKGDRVCDNGQCVAPAAPAAAATPPAVTAPNPEIAREREPVISAPAPEPEPPPMKHRSKGMMVGGIIITAAAPVALVVAYISLLEKSLCKIDNDSSASYSSSGGSVTYTTRDCSKYDSQLYGSLAAAAIFVGVGVPMIVIGAHKVPADPNTAKATIGPWATPTGGGLTLRVDL